MEKNEYCVMITEREVTTVEKCFCDRCKKLIWARYGREYARIFDYGSREYTEKVEWFKVTTGHHDWGNDSVDSIDNREYCRECIPFVFGKYLDGSREEGIENTEYIEVEHDYGWSLPTSFWVNTGNKGV